jgi:hypothetical protein
VLQILWNLATIFGELDHHLFVQADVHFGRVLHISLIVEFLSQTLACCSCCPNREASLNRRSRSSTLASAFFALLVHPEPQQHQRLFALGAWQSHLLASQVAPAVPSLLEKVAPAVPNLPELLKPNGQNSTILGRELYAEKMKRGGFELAVCKAVAECREMRRPTTFT